MSVRRSVRPSVRPSVTSYFGGQKQRRRTTYAVYPALLRNQMISISTDYASDPLNPTSRCCLVSLPMLVPLESGGHSRWREDLESFGSSSSSLFYVWSQSEEVKRLSTCFRFGGYGLGTKYSVGHVSWKQRSQTTNFTLTAW